MRRNISVIGGDLRIVKLVEMLYDEGFNIKTFAMDTAESLQRIEQIEKCKTIQEAVQSSEIVVGPIPLTSNKKDINTPFSNEKISIEELFNNLNGKTFIAGSISKDILGLAKEKNVNIIDLLEREELAVLNTISTAEGTIQIAISETAKTLHGSDVLVMGFGRIGKILAKMLQGIGARVYCEARKNSDLAWIKAYGYNEININDLDSHLHKFDIVINTIPVILLNEEKLNKLKKDCLVIDLASNPGGIDKEAAKRLGIKTIWALSLPGKVAPITSAEFIKETLYNILNEN